LSPLFVKLVGLFALAFSEESNTGNPSFNSQPSGRLSAEPFKELPVASSFVAGLQAAKASSEITAKFKRANIRTVLTPTRHLFEMARDKNAN
jgi:hypothetical protein